MKLINNLIKKFLRFEKIRTTAIATPTSMSEICQFPINNRLDYPNQLTTAIEIIQTVCNSKTDETNEKIVKVQKNQGNGNNNTNNKHLKFVSFPSTTDQIILINLQPHKR